MRIFSTCSVLLLVVASAFAGSAATFPEVSTSPAAGLTAVQPAGWQNNALPPVHELIPGPKPAYDVIQIFPSSDHSQSESCITVDPNDPDHLLVGVNAITNDSYPDFHQGYYYSFDGGATWDGGNILPGAGSDAGDPVVNIDLDGNAFFNYITWTSGMQCWSKKSTDGGVNWQTSVLFPNAGESDKPWAAVDVSSGSPYNGNVYSAWTDFNQYPYPIKFTRSTDNGGSFESAFNISGSTANYLAQGVCLAVGPAGELYAVWAIYKDGILTEKGIGFNVSYNGGASWGTAFEIPGLNVQGIRGYLKSTGIRVNSFPSIAVDRSSGAIYVIWTDNGSGDPDIMITSSDDDGATWSSPARINDDAYGNGFDQWFPWVTVDQGTGNVGVVFYDSRHDPANQLATMYVAYSADEGGSWTNLRVLDTQFMPTPIPGCAYGYQGDYIGIAAANGTLFPCWCMPEADGIYQVYFAGVPMEEPPQISIEITDPPPAMVRRGTTMNWRLRVENSGGDDAEVDYWLSITSDDLPPGMNPYIVHMVNDYVLSAGEVREGVVGMFIPEIAPISVYEVENIIGVFGETVYDSDSFTVSVFDF